MSEQLDKNQIKALAQSVLFAGKATMLADGDRTESENQAIFNVIASWESRSIAVTAVVEHLRAEIKRTGGYEYEFTEATQSVAQESYQLLSDPDKYRFMWLLEQITMHVASASGGNLTGQKVSELEELIGAEAMKAITGPSFNVTAYRAYIDSTGA